jgi:hypothetical protein
MEQTGEKKKTKKKINMCLYNIMKIYKGGFLMGGINGSGVLFFYFPLPSTTQPPTTKPLNFVYTYKIQPAHYVNLEYKMIYV